MCLIGFPLVKLLGFTFSSYVEYPPSLTTYEVADHAAQFLCFYPLQTGTGLHVA